MLSEARSGNFVGTVQSKVNRPLLLTTIGVGVVVLAIGLNYLLWREEVTEVAPTAEPAVAQDAGRTTPPAAAEPKKDVSDSPRFDVVRVNPEGETVMAGRARPGSTVTIFDKDKSIGEVTADKRGEWVFVPEKPLAPGSRQLGLEMRKKSGKIVQSESVVVLVVPEKGKDIAGRPTETPSQPLALKVPRQGAGPSTVLQKPMIVAREPAAGPPRFTAVAPPPAAGPPTPAAEPPKFTAMAPPPRAVPPAAAAAVPKPAAAPPRLTAVAPTPRGVLPAPRAVAPTPGAYCPHPGPWRRPPRPRCRNRRPCRRGPRPCRRDPRPGARPSGSASIRWITTTPGV